VREPDPSLIGRFTAPLGSVYGNVTRTQEMNNEQLLSSLKKAVDFPIDLIDLQLEFSQEEYISLSWHLTRSERVRISECLNSDSNAAAIEHLLKLLND
jgi:glycerol dehydrogenase-like iron-containing ADH family enzyme